MSQAIKRILLVEDELDTRLIMHLMLQLEKYDVDLANDGQTAVKLACHNSYDCILMDIGLPKLNGIDACLAIKRHESQENNLKSTPIIAITENVRSDKIEKCIEAGMTTILIKPISPQCLDRLMLSLNTAKTKNNNPLSKITKKSGPVDKSPSVPSVYMPRLVPDGRVMIRNDSSPMGMRAPS